MYPHVYAVISHKFGADRPIALPVLGTKTHSALSITNGRRAAGPKKAFFVLFKHIFHKLVKIAGIFPLDKNVHSSTIHVPLSPLDLSRYHDEAVFAKTRRLRRNFRRHLRI